MSSIALLLILVGSCSPFSPPSSMARGVRRSRNGHRLYALENHEGGVVNIESEESPTVVAWTEGSTVESSDEGFNADICEEGFVAEIDSQMLNLADTVTPESIVDDLWVKETQETNPVEIIVGGLLDETTDEERNAEAILAASAEVVLAKEDDVLMPVGENNGTIGFLSESEQQDVEAILAASEVAVVAAEASLTTEVAEQLFSFAENDTVQEEEKEMPAIVKAADVVGELEPKPVAPPVGKIVKFAIPAVGVWLCSPLLSLIDTSAVGLFAGTAQQAALNPAVAVTDYAALLIAFLYTAATNLVATAQETDRTIPGKPYATKAMIGVMQLSNFVGAGLGMFLFVFAKQLLRGIIGNDAVSPELFSAAMKYVRIRALGMPAAAILGSAQASCLGMQDIRSPLYVLLAAAVVNFLGDILFVRSSHPIIGGAAGAAWATVISQYAAVFMFVRWLCFKPRAEKKSQVVDLTKAILEMTGKPESKGQGRRDAFQTFFRRQGQEEKKPRKSILSGLLRRTQSKKQNSSQSDDFFSVKGLLGDKFRMRDFLKLPSREIRREFVPYVAPVTATQVGRVSGYIAMSHVVSSSLGTISMAAQQVIVSLFYCLCPVADSLSLTAQSFLPAIFEKGVSKERSKALEKTIRNFFVAGGIFSTVMCAAIGIIPFISGMFTSDPSVVAMVNSVSPLLLIFFAVHGFLCAEEGILLGRKDLGFLGKMYSSFFVVVPLLMLRVKRAALAGVQKTDLTSVWKVFVGYQLFRFAVWTTRVMILQRRTQKEASQVGESI